MINVESITRRCWTHTLAGALLAGGAWYAALRLASGDLSLARAELASQRLLLQGTSSDTSPADGSSEASLQQQELRFRSLAQAAPEPDKIYDAIVSSAKTCGVRIDRLNPSRNATRSREIETKTGLKVATTEFSMEFRGEYAAAVKFLSELETGVGLVRVNTLRMVPERTADGGLIVVTNIETSHFKPDTAEPTPSLEKPQS